MSPLWSHGFDHPSFTGPDKATISVIFRQLVEDQAGFETKRKRIVSHLSEAADAIEAIARQHTTSLKRDVSKGVIMMIARTMDELFGPSNARQPMYGQTATIASIVLERQVTAQEVRGTIRSGPWKITARFRF